MEGAVIQRLSSGAGEIVLAAAPETGQRGVIYWRGPHFEVSSFAPHSVSISPKIAMRLLAGLTFEDDENGLVISPNEDNGETVDVVSTSAYIHDVGMLDFLNPRRALSVIPAWAGKKVPVGELWHFPDDEDRNADYYLVGTDSGALVVSPGTYPHSSALNFISSIVSVRYETMEKVAR